MLARWQCRMGISIVSLMLNEKANKKGAGVEEGGCWACAAVSGSWGSMPEGRDRDA